MASGVVDEVCHGDPNGYDKVLGRVHLYDEFLREMIGMGFVVPKDFRGHPSDLKKESLQSLIDSEFKPLSFKHEMLLQLLELRGEEHIQRENQKRWEDITPSGVLYAWNKKDSRNFKSWYLDKYYFTSNDPLDESQIKYARKLSKNIGIFFN